MRHVLSHCLPAPLRHDAADARAADGRVQGCARGAGAALRATARGAGAAPRCCHGQGWRRRAVGGGAEGRRCQAGRRRGGGRQAARRAFGEGGASSVAVAACQRRCSAHASPLRPRQVAQMGSKSQDELARLKPAKLASGLRIDSQGARLGGGAFAPPCAWQLPRACSTRADSHHPRVAAAPQRARGVLTLTRSPQLRMRRAATAARGSPRRTWTSLLAQGPARRPSRARAAWRRRTRAR
jgi:hypothetical protein